MYAFVAAHDPYFKSDGSERLNHQVNLEKEQQNWRLHTP
jgi:hypothetical protein